MSEPGPPNVSPRERAGLAALRSVLVGLVLVGLFGIVGAIASYRADVVEARRQVRARLSRQGQVSAESLALHFDVLRAELQHLAETHLDALRAPDPAVLTAVHDDVSLFAGGVALARLDGQVLWSEPPGALLPGQLLPKSSWFQRVLGTDGAALDALSTDPTRLVVALPVHEKGRSAAVLLGVVTGIERMLASVQGPGETLLLLSSSDQVLVPEPTPNWAKESSFLGRVEALRASGGDVAWPMDGDQAMAELFPVRGTSLSLLALESESTSIDPIRARLNLQLGFLLLLQLVTLGAFFVFLRRTWTTFLDFEARTAEQQKLAALGTAASLIAHEVKNSLNGLKAAVSLLGGSGNTSEDARLVSKTVKGQVDRLGHLASSLLSFSRRPEARMVPLELDALTAEAVEALQSLPEFAEASVIRDLEPSVTLTSDPLLLTTAIDNLVRNAIEAAVAAKDLGLIERPVVRVSVERTPGAVVMGVEDNAGGPPEGFEARLGEPFFTTKPRGIGLGLTMARRAVEQLGGNLRFTRTATGSRFELRLPL